MKQYGLLFTLLILTQPTWGNFEFYRGVRQMGMGGASIAVVNDETALLSNPNGLGRLRDSFYTLIDPELTSGVDDSETLVGTGVLGSVNPDTVYDQLGDNLDNPYYFKGQIFPSLVVPNFGLGVLGRYEVLAKRNADGTMDYHYQNDYSVNLGSNLSFWGGRIKLGFAGRLINRVEYFGTRDPSVESLAISSFATEGMGLSADVGLSFAAPWKYLPTLTFLVRDVGGTSFTFGDGAFGNANNGTPQFQAQSVDAAFALFPIYGKYSRGVFTVEYTGIDNTENVEDHIDRLHIGTEINLFDAYFLRLGYHEGDWTAGFEYATGILQWQLATYSEEINLGSYSERDRQGILKLAIRF